MQILSAQISDARANAEIHVHFWQQAYRDLLPDKYLASLSIDQREEFWLDVLASNSSQVLIAVENGTVAAFLSYRESKDTQLLFKNHATDCRQVIVRAKPCLVDKLG